VFTFGRAHGGEQRDIFLLLGQVQRPRPGHHLDLPVVAGTRQQGSDHLDGKAAGFAIARETHRRRILGEQTQLRLHRRR
jgi:hypothetical protein